MLQRCQTDKKLQHSMSPFAIRKRATSPSARQILTDRLLPSQAEKAEFRFDSGNGINSPTFG